MLESCRRWGLRIDRSVQLFRLVPPLEHAPDQMASRPFVTLSVTLVPLEKLADPVVPVLTLIPAGDDVTRSPLRPRVVANRRHQPAAGGSGSRWYCGTSATSTPRPWPT